MREITTQQALIDALGNDRSGSVVLLKHSTRCPISAGAITEFQRFSETHPEVDCAYIDVIGFREVSDRLEMESGIPHHSPQVIVYHEGKVVWSASHGDITFESLEANVLKQ